MLQLSLWDESFSDLKKFLSDFFHVSRDDDEESGAKSDQDVSVAEPVVSLDRSITTLETNGNW